MTGKRKRTLPVQLALTIGTVLVALVIVYLTSTAARPEGEVVPRIGGLAPDFTLTDLDGKPVRLSDYRGRVVFLNFWATWCPPCREEMPDMEAVRLQVGERAVIVAVNLGEAPGEVRRFAESGGLGFKILLDSDGKVAERYMIRNIPTSFFIDRDGVIRSKYIGALDRGRMLAAIDAAAR